jgi:hypothetical protein
VIDCNIQIAVNTTRGGVVLEDGTAVTPTLVARGLSSAGKISFPECFPCWSPYDIQYTQFLGVWKPNCWCAKWSATDSNGIRDYQCLGDTDGKKETLSGYRVFNSDYQKLAQCWQKKATSMRGILNCFCADFDHKSETLSGYRVFNSDYQKLAASWQKKDTVLKSLFGNCPQ